MRFTKYNSMEDILEYPGMDEYLKIFYSEYLLEMYPGDMRLLPVARLEQAAHTPWGEPFSIVTDQLMDAVNLVMDIFENHMRRAVSLWDMGGSGWNLDREARGGKDQVFLIAPAEKLMREQERKILDGSIAAEIKRKPAVIICPGGGYESVCFSGEGTPVMHYMEAKGYRAFILRYRTGTEGIYPAPQEDLSLAVRYVREHAEEYGVDPDDIMTMGFSAGGHLCASQAGLTLPDYQGALQHKKFAPKLSHPDKVCLCYPVISFIHEPHEGSAQTLTGGKEELRTALSAEEMITEKYPPTFLWTCADDDCVPPSNAVRMAKALEEAGVRHELHVYRSGGHGCALAFSKEAHGWSQAMTEFFR